MKHPRLQLNKRAFWCGVAVLAVLRCGLTGVQQAYTWVGGAPLDDELMFRAAQAITAGEWLGAYDYLTLSKAMFFPVWLALLHALHLPYLVSGAALWCETSPRRRRGAPPRRAAAAGCPWGGLRRWRFCRPAGRRTRCAFTAIISSRRCACFFLQAWRVWRCGPCFIQPNKSRCGPGCWRQVWGWPSRIWTPRMPDCSCCR